MSKQSMPGDKTGWKRGAGTYSRTYADLKQYGTPDSSVSRLSDVERASAMGKPDGYSNALPRAKGSKGGGTY